MKKEYLITVALVVVAMFVYNKFVVNYIGGK
jgi:hypothetical protein